MEEAEMIEKRTIGESECWVGGGGGQREVEIWQRSETVSMGKHG